MHIAETNNVVASREAIELGREIRKLFTSYEGRTWPHLPSSCGSGGENLNTNYKKLFQAEGGKGPYPISGVQKPSSVLKTLTECRSFSESVKSSFEAFTF